MSNSLFVTLNKEQYRNFKENFASPVRLFMRIEGLGLWSSPLKALDAYDMVMMGECASEEITFQQDDISMFLRIAERVKLNLHNWQSVILQAPKGDKIYDKLQHLDSYLASILPTNVDLPSLGR